jgi:hypothetical protein
MSKGAGIVERRIADLLAATRDRALSIDEITDHAFELRGAKPTRAQRLSATRAAHRVLKRTRDTYDRGRKLINQAHTRTKAALVDACRVEARGLLRSHEHIVRALATELLIRRTLTGIEIDSVIARAIAAKLADAEMRRRRDWRERAESARAFIADVN